MRNSPPLPLSTFYTPHHSYSAFSESSAFSYFWAFPLRLVLSGATRFTYGTAARGHIGSDYSTLIFSDTPGPDILPPTKTFLFFSFLFSFRLISPDHSLGIQNTQQTHSNIPPKFPPTIYKTLYNHSPFFFGFNINAGEYIVRHMCSLITLIGKDSSRWPRNSFLLLSCHYLSFVFLSRTLSRWLTRLHLLHSSLHQLRYLSRHPLLLFKERSLIVQPFHLVNGRSRHAPEQRNSLNQITMARPRVLSAMRGGR